MDLNVRIELESRMRAFYFCWCLLMSAEVAGIVNYIVDVERHKALGFWVKIKPTDSYLDRELRASGKLISRCLQHGEDFKRYS